MHGTSTKNIKRHTLFQQVGVKPVTATTVADVDEQLAGDVAEGVHSHPL